MKICVVGNIVKDVYLNLDHRADSFETDPNGIKWLDLSFDGSKHSFFSRVVNYGGAAVSLETLQQLGLDATISGSNLNFANADTQDDVPSETSEHRYILVSDEKVTYFAPSTFAKTLFVPPAEPVDYLYLDRSAHLADPTPILDFLHQNPNTQLILYAHDLTDPATLVLLPHATLIFTETSAPALNAIDPAKIVYLSDHQISYTHLSTVLHPDRVDVMTHLSLYSIAAATILGAFLLNNSVEDSLELARLNVENSQLNGSLSLNQLRELQNSQPNTTDLELIAMSLLLPGKGILAADESGGSIQKKFAQLNIPDTYDTRRSYRNLFLATDHLENYVTGVILFDETARQFADNGQTFVDFLTSRQIIPGIKVDQGLVPFDDDPTETYTQGLDGLDERLAEYHQMGLRFAKWRAAFTAFPSDRTIHENCEILASYAQKCQEHGLVPIVEPEVVHDATHSIDDCASTTARILDALFIALQNHHINLRACILKTNMVLAGKQFNTPSTPTAIGTRTAEVLKNHVPVDLAGVVFLSGGQTPEEATDNLAAIIKNGPFPWPVTFSFARALQDPALYAWAGNDGNTNAARAAFVERLERNCKALILP